MTRISVPILLLLFGCGTAHGADLQSVRSREVYLPSGEVAVVSEGNIEPRSVGSYTLRIYSASTPEFPYDDYVAGIVRPRDGFIESAAVHDIDMDGKDEVIVIIRNAGTGSYLSADAIQYNEGSLTLLVTVNGLESKEDPIRALEIAHRKGD